MEIKQVSTIHTGDLIFFTYGHKFGQVIKSVTKSPWTHVGLVYNVKEGGKYLTIAEGLTSGFRISDYTWADIANHVSIKRVVARLSKSERDAFRLYCDSLVATPYDYGALLAIFVYMVTGGVVKPYLNKNSLICSEAAALVWEHMGYLLVPNKPADYVTPADLYRSKNCYHVTL